MRLSAMRPECSVQQPATTERTYTMNTTVSFIKINPEIAGLRKITDERFVLSFNPLDGPGLAGPRGPQPDPTPFLGR
jgi:hypothetical protein